MKKLVRGGTVVAASGIFMADVLIEGDKIAGIGHFDDLGDSASEKELEIIDAQDCIIVPGGIDAHTHIDFPLKGFRSNDDYWSGTCSAVAGGTTTIAVFLPAPRTDESLAENIRGARIAGDENVVSDYCFQQTLSSLSPSMLGEIPRLVAAGYPGFKVFLGSDIAMNDRDILRVMEILRKCGGQLLVNGGNLGMEQFATGALTSAERADLSNYGRNRPEVIEAEGLSRAAYLARLTGMPIYAVHISSAQALGEIKKARAAGCSVVAETCPQYLLLSDGKYKLNYQEALKYTLNPPLRDRSNFEPLWSGLAEGSLDIVSSDHCPFNLHGQKDQSPSDFLKVPNGLPGIEPRLLLLYSEGVCAHRLSLRRFVEVVSTNPAKYLGLYPRKGTIVAGSDADIAIIDPRPDVIFSKRSMFERNDYTPYESMPRHGTIRATLVRGEVVFDAERGIIAQKGFGRYLPRFFGNST
jgi:dihydropyrimidinase